MIYCVPGLSLDCGAAQPHLTQGMEAARHREDLVHSPIGEAGSASYGHQNPPSSRESTFTE